MGLYIQFGAGFSAPNGWLNFDSSPTLMIGRIPIFGRFSTRLLGNSAPFPKGIKYGNIVKGLPVENGTADGIYGSHVLEHLSLDDMRKALINCKLMLRPEGIIRVIVPDLFERASRYVSEKIMNRHLMSF